MKRWLTIGLAAPAGCGAEKDAQLVVAEEPREQQSVEGYQQFVEVFEDGDEDPRTTARISDETKTARVTVTEDYRENPGAPVYIEGALQFVELRWPGNPTPVAIAELSATPRALAVPPGTYTVISYTRPCSGHCQQSLDPPVDRCRKGRVRVDGNLSLSVRTTVGEKCVIR
ncbi:hypothetical protein DVA67_012375 [Solirubrobacter sp. CPCC 204708]|uniref:Lipoprotein n=1 Tax=Solirubrobacter deserti TaxID=2282478 RepID=A0ABT4RKC8_9ACTN|nr:hypothetical protein [Solirubrobacter deserti]MBE2316771.1 hypothetical protein [Solirubrobacter deserti]MDA0139013.1 hypothetical protein [Solirubrobacter deserti]